MKTVHDGFDKQVWIEAYDDAALNFEWCQIMKGTTPLDITPDQIIKSVGHIEREIDDRWKRVNGVALELGADWGRLALYKTLTCPNLKYVACNTSTVMTDHLRTITDRLGLGERLKCMVMFAEDLQYPDATFDAVYIFETLEHVGNLDQSISEIKRVLKSDGVVLFTLPLLDYADGGYHTQRHSKQFWLDKFKEHGLAGDVSATKHPSGKGLFPNDETGLMGCLKKMKCETTP